MQLSLVNIQLPSRLSLVVLYFQPSTIFFKDRPLFNNILYPKMTKVAIIHIGFPPCQLPRPALHIIHNIHHSPCITFANCRSHRFPRRWLFLLSPNHPLNRSPAHPSLCPKLGLVPYRRVTRASSEFLWRPHHQGPEEGVASRGETRGQERGGGRGHGARDGEGGEGPGEMSRWISEVCVCVRQQPCDTEVRGK